MLQTWHIFAVSTVVFGSISSLIVRALMKHDRHDPVLSMIVFQCMLTAITLCFALYKGFVFPFPPELWPRMLLSAILYAVGSLSNFYASKHLEAGELTILNASGALVTIVLGVFLIGNTFTVLNALGTVLILLSIFVLYAGEKMKMNVGVWYAIAVTVSYAVAVVNDVIIIRTYSSTSFVPVMSLMPGIVIAILFYRKLPRLAVFFKRDTLLHIAAYSFFYGLSAVTFYLALDNHAPVSQLSPISRASIIVTVLLSAIFLNERKDLGKKIFSALLVSAGVLLLA
jgi:drug/metabolite transporter (DMT)-like permease